MKNTKIWKLNHKIWVLIGRQAWVRWLLTSIFTAVIIAACRNIAINNDNGKVQTFHSPSMPCQVVKHEMGETCVPMNPQRIVTLAPVTLATVLALGVKPIGTTGADFPSYLQQVSDIQLLGEQWQPNFEGILLLKPDLILGMPYHRGEYNKLSQIAPTVLFKWNGTSSWKQHLEDVAEVLNKANQAKSLMQDYKKRLEEFRLKMGDRLQKLQISYIDVLAQAFIWCDVKNSFAGMILEDAGLKRPPAQAIVSQGGYIMFGLETIQPNADGDVIFTSYWSNEDGKKALERIQNHPLWLKLKAVQQNQVYVVNRHVWRGSNILAAYEVIEDLFKYLINTP